MTRTQVLPQANLLEIEIQKEKKEKFGFTMDRKTYTVSNVRGAVERFQRLLSHVLEIEARISMHEQISKLLFFDPSHLNAVVYLIKTKS